MDETVEGREGECKSFVWYGGVAVMCALQLEILNRGLKGLGAEDGEEAAHGIGTES